MSALEYYTSFMPKHFNITKLVCSQSCNKTFSQKVSSFICLETLPSKLSLETPSLKIFLKSHFYSSFVKSTHGAVVQFVAPVVPFYALMYLKYTHYFLY